MTKPISQHGIQDPSLNDGLQNTYGSDTNARKSIAPLKLSLSQMTTLRWSLTDEVPQVKQTGFDAIGLWRPKLVESGEDYARQLFEQHRISVSSLSFAGGFTGGCGLSYLEAIADGRQAIDLAESIGAENVIVVGGPRHGHTSNHSRRLVVDGLKELADFAELAQVKLSLLPMHPSYSKKWTFLNTLDESLDVLSRIDHPLVGLAFDTYHLGHEAENIARIPEIASLTNIVQISDGGRAPQSQPQMPGQGELPIRAVIQAFQTAGFSGYFDIQVWSDQVWKSNYIHLIEQAHATIKGMSIRSTVKKSS